MALRQQISHLDIKWQPAIDKTMPWAPIKLSPLSYLPSFKDLSAQAQLRYNHLFSLGINEYFSLFEEHFLIATLQNLKNIKNPQLSEAIEHFIDDERRHSEMFHYLNRFAQGETYSTQKKYFLLEKSFWLSPSFKWFTLSPRTFVIWVWIAVFFEERTLLIAKEFIKAKDGIETHFSQAHRLHMIEEVRHVSLDSFLIDEVYKTSNTFVKSVTAFVFKRLISRLMTPKSVSKAILKRMEEEFPSEQDTLQRLKSEMPLIKDNQEYQSLFFSEFAMPRTTDLLNQFPELRGIIKATS